MMTTGENPACKSIPSTDVRLLPGRLLLVALFGGFVLLGLVFPFPLSGRLWSQLFDLAHAPVFCLLLIAIAGLLDPGSIGLPARFAKLREIGSGETMLLAGGCLLLGCLGEFLQIYAGRSPSVFDLAANGAGVLAGVLWIKSCPALGGQRSLLQSVSFLVLAAALVRPILGVWGAVQQSLDFPMLASFERQIDLGAWAEVRSSIERTAEWSTDGDHSLSVRLFPGRFSGINMIWPSIDWRGYDRLSWDIRNTSEKPLMLTLKIHDRQHIHGGFDPLDRFECSFVVPPAAIYPLSVDLADVAAAPELRTMCMDQIAAVELFTMDLERGHTLMLDDMRLVQIEKPSTTEVGAASQ